METGEEPSSVAMSTEDSSDANSASRGEHSSTAPAKSSDPSEENIPAEIDSEDSSKYDLGPSGLTRDELAFEALEEDYDNNGIGLDIVEIFNYVEERHNLYDDFKVQMQHQLVYLVSNGQVEKVGNRYKLLPAYFGTRGQPGEASNPTKSVSSEGSFTSKLQDISSPEENPQKDAAVEEVEEAEHLEVQAKEAHPTCNKIPHSQFDTPRQPGETSEGTPTESSGDFSSTNPEDKTSSSSSSVPKAPEENPQIDEAVKKVAEAEDLEFQAKEAQELADEHARLLKLESRTNLQLALDILNRCTKGQNVFLR